MSDQTTGVRTKELVRRAGITYRQADYWTRTGLLRPSIEGSVWSGVPRQWSEADVREATIVKKMLDAGASLQTVRKAMPLIRTTPGRWLVASANNAAIAANAEELVAALLAANGSGTVVDLGETAA